MKDYQEFDLLSPLHASLEPEAVRGNGAALITAEGQELVDLNEMRVVLGQGNEAFTAAMSKAFSEFTAPKNGRSPAKERLLRYLDETTDGSFAAAFLTSSGSEAVEWAVRLAKKMTGREEVLSFWNSIHGRTYLSASLSGLYKRKAGYGPLAPGVLLLPYPNCGSCPVGAAGGSCGFACLELAKQAYASGSAQRAAAVIVEPCQGAGVILPPPGYLAALQTWAHSQGMLVILDEIQSGMGRTGWMYLYQREKLAPDMLLLGKALGNGIHIAALLVRQRPEADALPALSGGSGDDPLACAAACEVFRQLEDGLLDHVRAVGGALTDGLRAIASHPLVRESRGLGLAAALEFHAEADCAAAVSRLEERGYLVGRQGATLYCKPPYVITEEQVRGFLTALAEVLDVLAAHGAPGTAHIEK